MCNRMPLDKNQREAYEPYSTKQLRKQRLILPEISLCPPTSGADDNDDRMCGGLSIQLPYKSSTDQHQHKLPKKKIVLLYYEL